MAGCFGLMSVSMFIGHLSRIQEVLFMVYLTHESKIFVTMFVDRLPNRKSKRMNGATTKTTLANITKWLQRCSRSQYQKKQNLPLLIRNHE
ncbi:MAG: hypothetical protein OXE77_00025 [Flavobacteriaceae bacterium]|nr:hypothetical protein [Flavobacteriaceae bacterium]MCY4268418.1 hypothetical protein [Flavobacteriaceae bacterium]MCY4299563.1 hypothetical protein [Flavobacteriaceae bacterium]